MNFFLFDSQLINILTLLLILILTVYYFTVSTFNHWKNLGVKFVAPVPFFGNFVKVIFRKQSSADNQQEIYNVFPEEKYAGMFMFRSPMLMLRDPYLIHSIMSKDFANFCDRGLTFDERIDLLSLHLVNLGGQKWKTLRSKLTPAFSSGKLKVMCSQFEDCANVLSDYLATSLSSNDSVQEIREIMAKFTTDVIGSCAFGMQFNSLKDPESQFRKMGQEIFRPSFRFILKFMARTFHPSLPYYLNLKALRQDVESFFLDFVKNTAKERENNSDRKDFIQILLDLQKEDLLLRKSNEKDDSFVLTDNVLASNAFVFFIAGFETTAATMSFFLLELAANPSIQEAVKDEIVKALGNHEGKLNYDTIKDLPYMDMVISETLRKYPIATALFRQCTETYHIPGSSVVLQKGTRVFIPVFALHRDPKYFPDPERFDPERFSPQNKTKIIPGTYLPFGEGPRICIGLRFAMMEMKYAFCKIMPKYQFSLSERMEYPVVFKRGGAPLLAPHNGIWLHVSPRPVGLHTSTH